MSLPTQVAFKHFSCVLVQSFECVVRVMVSATMRTRLCLILFLYWFNDHLSVFAFNLEPRIPVIKHGPLGSYFGYSVAEHVIVNRGIPKYIPKILVGAPKDQGVQPGTNKTGAIFSCPLTNYENDCVPISIDDKKYVDSGELKDDQWLGVTLKSQGRGGFVLTCAHRYVKLGRDFRWGNGICYSLTQYLDFDNYFEPCFEKPKHKAHEEFGYCQVGTSGAFTEDNNFILGTPGPYTWRGTIFTNNIRQGLRDDNAWYMGGVSDSESPVDKYSYLGMAVTSGKFFRNKMSYIAGAPRAGNTGQVVFYSKRQNDPTLEVDFILKGEVFASSYGYEVAAADLTGDGYPDLIVGAPFYYGKDSGGAIYIYINNWQGINKDSPYIRITGKEESRFGFAIANCSDLNKDGFEDIAVGAPYEGNGHVYIFLGRKEGIVKEPAQVIKAEDLPTTIKSFGYSLSGGIDLDENNYPDLVVGAYESDKVLVLRARPIIHIESSIEGDLTNIDPSLRSCRDDITNKRAVCFKFNACFTIVFNNTVNTPSLNLNYTIEAETFSGKRFSRVYFRNAKHPESGNVVQQSISLPAQRSSHRRCTTETVFLYENIRDILTPIKFKLTYSLVQAVPKMPRVGGSLPNINHYPILNQQEAIRIFEATFDKDCGPDDICTSNTTINITLQNDQEFILGSQNEVSVLISALNSGEPAYEAAVYISFPPTLTYQGYDVEDKIEHLCEPINNTLITCSLGNPFKYSEKSSDIMILFYPSHVKDVDTSLTFMVKANSTSHESNPLPVTVHQLAIKRVADLSITGSSGPEQVLYSGEVKGESAIKTEEAAGNYLFHNYKITNKGPSDVSLLHVNISWPYEKASDQEHGKWLLYLMTKPRVLGGRGECVVDEQYVNTLNLEYSKSSSLSSTDYHNTLDSIDIDDENGGSHDVNGVQTDKEHGQEEKQTHTSTTYNRTTEYKWTRNITWTRQTFQSTGYQGRVKRDAEPTSESLTDDQKSVVLDCKDGTAKCFTITCQIRDLLADTNANVNIRLVGRLWSSTFVADYPDVEKVSVISRAHLSVDAIPEIKTLNEDDDYSYAETKAIPDFPSSQKTKKVPIWIYILAAFCGLFLLVLVILCLWKLGFFKRRTPNATMSGNLEKQNEFNSYH